MRNTVKYALINSLGTAAYVVLIVSFMYFLGNQFPSDDKTIFAPIALLMLFVFSAAFTGALVFGRPVIWYLDGKKKEAVSLLFYTLSIFLMITLAVFITLILAFS